MWMGDLVRPARRVLGKNGGRVVAVKSSIEVARGDGSGAVARVVGRAVRDVGIGRWWWWWWWLSNSWR
jgi:hypothetical protein